MCDLKIITLLGTIFGHSSMSVIPLYVGDLAETVVNDKACGQHVYYRWFIAQLQRGLWPQ